MKDKILKIGEKSVQAGLVFACTLCVLCVLFLISALIPRETVRENILTSAYRMEEQGERYLLEEGKEWTRMDNYADAEWLNILYSLDPDRSWQTMFESPIYVDFGGEEDSLVHALILRVEQELDANTVYDRYWHGTVMLLRPLLVFMTMEQIYWFMAIVFVVLFVILCALLLKRGFTWLTVILAVLVIPCGLEYIPFCAEYWSPWLISLVLMIYILARRPGWWEGSLLMLVSGTAVAYMDFLTTETVAFGLPFLLLLLLWQQREPGRKAGEYFACFVRSGLLWAAGYGGALLVKWVGSSMLLGDDRIDFALNRAAYWDSGYGEADITGTGGILDNVRMLFPFRRISDDMNLLLLLIVILGALFCFVFLFRKKQIPSVCPAVFLIALVPVLRFLTLSFHVSYHAFFTYRALYLTLAALAVCVGKMTDWEMTGKYIKKMLRIPFRK